MKLTKEIQNIYFILTDRIVYNQLYALKYPLEDRTSIENEHSKIIELISFLKNQFHRDYNRQQLDFAISEVNNAFDLYRNGKDGFHNLECALDYIKNSKRTSQAKATFVIDPKGTIKSVDEEKNGFS